MTEEEKQKIQEDFEPAYTESSDDTAMLRAVLQSEHARNIAPVSVYRQPDFDGIED